MENWYKNTYVGCTITEYQKKCARLSATGQKQTTLWTQACLNLKKTHITEKSDRTKMEMVMLCTTGPAPVPSKT
jgi:hypothetical protein